MKIAFVSVALIALGAQAFKADQRTLSVALQKEDSSIDSLLDDVEGAVDDTTGAGAAAADTTGAGAAAAASKKSWVLDILTDFGEETDDEVMVTAACLIALKDNTMQLNIMFLDKDPKAQEENLQAFLGPDDWSKVEKATNIAIYGSHGKDSTFKQLGESAKTMMAQGKKHYVLQVGPIHGISGGFNAYTDALTSMPYSYALVGTMGNTLNSQRDAEETANTLWKNAEKKSIVDTAKGRGAFKFSYSAVEGFFKGEQALLDKGKQALLDHVVKIGFRNTVGRADSKVGKYVANLVASQDTSANYQTVKSVAEVLKKKQPATTAITAEDTVAITAVVDQYYDALTKGMYGHLKECDKLVDTFKVHGWNSEKKAVCSACSEACFVDKHPPTLVQDTKKQGICPACGEVAFCCFAHEAGKLNGPGNPTKKQVKEGYAFILKTLKEEFDVPIDLIVSGGPGQWEKTWDGIDGSLDESSEVVKFKPQYSAADDEEFNDEMRNSFKIWTDKVKKHDLPMTPNYDTVGLIYALQEMHSGFSTDQFGCKDNNKGMNTCQLTSDLVNSPASFGNLLSPFIAG